MTPSEYAAEELAIWQRALKEQREAKARLAAARKKRKHAIIIQLMPQVGLLRTKADLLLAEAVALMCAFRSEPFQSSWLTGPGDSPDDERDVD